MAELGRSSCVVPGSRMAAELDLERCCTLCPKFGAPGCRYHRPALRHCGESNPFRRYRVRCGHNDIQEYKTAYIGKYRRKETQKVAQGEVGVWLSVES
jgi:hypothetical protein